MTGGNMTDRQEELLQEFKVSASVTWKWNLLARGLLFFFLLFFCTIRVFFIILCFNLICPPPPSPPLLGTKPETLYMVHTLSEISRLIIFYKVRL